MKASRLQMIAESATRMQNRRAAEREALAADLRKEQRGLAWRFQREAERDAKMDARELGVTTFPAQREDY
jgi:hypothetical protein